jgi:pimeloyl-ACP methyl ester carboxylesterase
MTLYASVVEGGLRAAVYLPGMGRYGDDGRNLASAICGSRSTHLIDLPGTGRSPAVPELRRVNDFAAVLDSYLDAADLAQVDLIGHSLGGILGLAYALTRQNRVRSLTLLDSGYWRIPRFPTQMCGTLGYAIPVLDALHRLFGERLLSVLGNTPANAHHPAEPIDHQNDLAEIHPKALGMLLAVYRADPPAMLHRLQTPCLLMYGDKQVTTPQRKRVLERIDTDDRIRLIKLAGDHYAHREDPHAGQVVAEFLATLR